MPGFVKTFIRYRYLIAQLVSRDFKVKYKRSVLGVLWSVLHPLFMMLIMTLVFQNLFKMTSSGSMNYPVYIITGLTVFNFFNEATTMAMTAITDNFSLITKIKIPKAVFPLSRVLSSCVNLVFSLIALYAVILFTQEPITWHHILLMYDFSCLILFSLGLGFFLSTLMVFFRDMRYLYSLITLAWNYLTPIFWDISIISDNLVNIFRANPLYQYVTYARNVILYHRIPTVNQSLFILIAGVVALIVGFLFFKSQQNKFINYI